MEAAAILPRPATPPAARARLALAALVAALAGPAAADRHCLPAADGYFAARQQVLERDGAACASVADRARAELAEADAAARICGCVGLIDRLRDLGAPAGSCEHFAARLLASEDRVNETLRACHR
jgi:hypothetical protein